MDFKCHYDNIKEKIDNGTIERSDIRGLIFDYTMATRRLLRNGYTSDIREYTDALLDFQYLLSEIKKNPDKYTDSDKLILEYEKFVELRRFCIAVFPDVRGYANYVAEYLESNPHSRIEHICEDMGMKKKDVEKALLWLEENGMLHSQECRMMHSEEYDVVKTYSLTDKKWREVREEKKQRENDFLF